MARRKLRASFDPDTKNKLFSTLTKKRSQYRSWNQDFYHSHNTKSFSMSTLKPRHFRLVIVGALNILVRIAVIPQQYVSHKYEYQLVFFLTFLYYRKVHAVRSGGLTRFPHACYLRQFREFESPLVRSRINSEGFFLVRKMLAEIVTAWVTNIRWKFTSSGNAEPFAR